MIDLTTTIVSTKRYGAWQVVPSSKRVHFFMKAKCPEPPHYLCTTHQGYCDKLIFINLKWLFHPMHVGLNPNTSSIATVDRSIKRLSFHESTNALKLHHSHLDLLLNDQIRSFLWILGVLAVKEHLGTNLSPFDQLCKTVIYHFYHLSN